MTRKLLDTFLAEKKYLQNISPGTLSGYRYWSNVVEPLLPNDPSQLTKSDLTHVVVTLRERGLKPATVNTYIRNFNTFFRRAHAEGHQVIVVIH